MLVDNSHENRSQNPTFSIQAFARFRQELCKLAMLKQC